MKLGRLIQKKQNQKSLIYKIRRVLAKRLEEDFITIHKNSFIAEWVLTSSLFSVVKSYFIPGCNERYLGTALISNGGSNSIGDYGTRSGKQYNL